MRRWVAHEQSRAVQHAHLSVVRKRQRRVDADRRLPLLLGLPRVPHARQAEAGTLLRFLQLRRRAVPPDPGTESMLRLNSSKS